MKPNVNVKAMSIRELSSFSIGDSTTADECLRRLQRIEELCEMGDTYSKRDFHDKVCQAVEGRFGNKTMKKTMRKQIDAR